MQDRRLDVQGRLLVENIDSGTGDHALVKRLREVLLDHDRSARHVDQHRRCLHHGKFLRVDHPSRGIVQRAVQHDDI